MNNQDKHIWFLIYSLSASLLVLAVFDPTLRPGVLALAQNTLFPLLLREVIAGALSPKTGN
jgi:hypothetical protein